MKRVLVIGLLLALVGLAAFGASKLTPLFSGEDLLSKAEIAVEDGMWEYARDKLDQYLQSHPSSGKAHLLMAEALVRDESLVAIESAKQALEHLDSVSKADRLYQEAQLKSARINLFTLRRAGRAEQAIERVLEADPDSLDGNYLMWKVRDLTGRSYVAGPYFWKVFQQTTPEFQAPRLREWYMSQFFPATANPDLVANMAFEPLADVQDPDLLRLLHFYREERDSPLIHAALAKWFLEDKNAEGAAKLMVDSAEELDNEASEPLFLAVLIRCHLEEGNLDLAKRIYEQWPADERSGYDYLVVKAMVNERCLKDYKTAADAYEQALNSEWPGPVEWQLRNRYANCLVKLKRNDEVVKQRELATRIADMMTPETHGRNRQALRDVTNPDQLRIIQSFYQELGCPREAKAWGDVIARLEESKKAAPDQASLLETAP